jgi:hypothetical protein
MHSVKPVRSIYKKSESMKAGNLFKKNMMMEVIVVVIWIDLHLKQAT